MRRHLVLIFLTMIWQQAAAGHPYNILDRGDEIPLEKADEYVSQLFILKAFPGGNESHFSVLENQVKRHNPGGLIIHNGSPFQAASLIDRLNRASDTPLWVGAGLNISGWEMPGDHILNQVDDISVLHETGVMLGEKFNKIGIDFIVDPSLDVSDGSYSFGRYYAQGYYTEGITPVFRPDSLLDFPSQGGVILPYEVPYRVNKRRVDYSRTTTARLRSRGYDGLIIVELSDSDVLDDNAAFYAIQSGADMVIYPGDPSKAISSLRKRIRNGDLPKKKIREKYSKVLQKKYRVYQPFSEQVRFLDGPKDQYMKQKLNVASIATVKRTGNLVPFRMLDTLEIALISNKSHATFNTHLKKYNYIFELGGWENTDYINSFDAVVVPVSKGEDLTWINKIADKSNIILVTYGFEDLEEFSGFDYVLSIPEKNEYTQRFAPQVLFGAISSKGRMNTTLPQGFSQKIQMDPIGRLSYDQPLSASMDPDILDGIDEIAREAIEKGATPGLQVLVARRGKVVYNKSYGYQTYAQKLVVTDETIYDLASVTKVMSTLQGVMFMNEKGIIDLDTTLSSYLPELRESNKEDMAIRDILLHQAGLRPWLPFWRETMDDREVSEEFYSAIPEEEFSLQVSEGLYAISSIRDSVWSWIIDTRLMRKKETEHYGYRYSDIGFYMMQRLIESKLNQPLNEFVSQNFYDPLGMMTTTYLPLCKFEVKDIAPTAEDSYFRKGLIDGLVHDEGAAMFGGVAGHSGLFSNANDLAKLCQMLLQGGEYGGERYFKPETIELFSKKQVKDNRRGLGWDKPNLGHWRSPTSRHASGDTFGHTGFTGTAVWIDPAYDLVYIFLSNRINPDAENGKLMELNIRSRIQDLIYKSIWELDQYKETFTPEP